MNSGVGWVGGGGGGGGAQYSNNLWGVGEFHCLPMYEKIRYLPPHRRKGGTLENIAREKPNVVRIIAPRRIFAQTNSITQPGVYEGGFSFN